MTAVNAEGVAIPEVDAAQVQSLKDMGGWGNLRLLGRDTPVRTGSLPGACMLGVAHCVTCYITARAYFQNYNRYPAVISTVQK